VPLRWVRTCLPSVLACPGVRSLSPRLIASRPPFVWRRPTCTTPPSASAVFSWAGGRRRPPLPQLRSAGHRNTATACWGARSPQPRRSRVAVDDARPRVREVILSGRIRQHASRRGVNRGRRRMAESWLTPTSSSRSGPRLGSRSR
jgi:hypothetical protein